jgi:hypothetical protein
MNVVRLGVKLWPGRSVVDHGRPGFRSAHPLCAPSPRVPFASQVLHAGHRHLHPFILEYRRPPRFVSDSSPDTNSTSCTPWPDLFLRLHPPATKDACPTSRICTTLITHVSSFHLDGIRRRPTRTAASHASLPYSTANPDSIVHPCRCSARQHLHKELAPSSSPPKLRVR